VKLDGNAESPSGVMLKSITCAPKQPVLGQFGLLLPASFSSTVRPTAKPVVPSVAPVL